MSLLAGFCKVKAFEWKAETISAIKINVLQLIECSRYQKKSKTSMGDVRATTYQTSPVFIAGIVNCLMLLSFIWCHICQFYLFNVELSSPPRLLESHMKRQDASLWSLNPVYSCLSVWPVLGMMTDDFIGGSCIVTICSGDFPLVM